MNARIIALSLFTLLVSHAAQANTDVLMSSVRQIHVHETSFELIDSKCNSNISLSEEKLAEINQQILAKTGMTYSAAVAQVSDPEEVNAKVELSTRALLESDCDPRFLEYWHMVMSESLEEHLSSFQ